MSIAETNTSQHRMSGLNGGKILHFRQTLQDKTGAMSGWASERAGAMREAAAQRPFATAGASAAAAFIGGIALGLLLSGRSGQIRARASEMSGQAGALAARGRSLFHR